MKQKTKIVKAFLPSFVDESENVESHSLRTQWMTSWPLLDQAGKT